MTAVVGLVREIVFILEPLDGLEGQAAFDSFSEKYYVEVSQFVEDRASEYEGFDTKSMVDCVSENSEGIH